MSKRLRVGVIGCGLIAQVMHLHYLRELAGLFEIAAVCDISRDLAETCARAYGVAEVFTDWRRLLAARLDAVLILTSGSHAPIASAAAQAGLHMLIEKPLCFSVAEGERIVDEAAAAGVVMMVGYNKRYDPAYLRAVEEARTLRGLRLVRVTTLESPFAPYVAHYPLTRANGPLDPALAADTEARIAAAVPGADAAARQAYHAVLLDSMVHEFNAVRGLLGEPDSLDFADIRENGLTTVLRFGGTQCIIAWVDLPGMARYSMEFCLYALDRRLTLSFPSPFLRSMPTQLAIEGGDDGSARAWKIDETSSYAESFKEELLHFHACIETGRSPRTSGADALADIALCEAIVAAHGDRRARAHPTRLALPAAAS
jgi:predicted dehydrogenase